MSRQLTHYNFGAVISCVSDVLIAIAKTQKEMWKNVNYVGLKKPAQNGAKHFKCKKSAWNQSVGTKIVEAQITR